MGSADWIFELEENDVIECNGYVLRNISDNFVLDRYSGLCVDLSFDTKEFDNIEDAVFEFMELIEG